jgi:hypothetical protein
MSILQEDKNIVAERRFITSRGIVVTGWLLVLLLCMAIIGSTIFMMVSGLKVPEHMINWTSTVIGFFFGTFATLVKEFMSEKT